MKRKHSTARRRISNLPFTELYSWHNEAVTHRPPAPLCLPAAATPPHASWSRSSSRDDDVNNKREKKKTTHSDQHCFTTEATWTPSTQPSSCSMNWIRLGFNKRKKKKKEYHSIGDSFALRADESFCLFCTHLSRHSQDLPVNHNAICLRAAFMRANISRVSKYAITAKFPVLYWTLEGSWDFKQCNDCMLHETIMLSNNNWTLRLNNRQRKVCSSSHCLPAAQTVTGPKLLIWCGKNPISCDRLFTQSPFMWGIPSWNVVNGHLHFVVLNSIDVDLTIHLKKKKWNCARTFFLNCCLSNLYFISFNLALAVYPETPPRISSPSLFPHLWLKAVRMWHEVKMFYQSNGENSAQGQIHLRGFSTSICLAACFFFPSSFFCFFLRIFILLFFIPGCLHVPRHTFTPCGTGFWNWILRLFLKKKPNKQEKNKNKQNKKQSRGQINTDDFTTPTYIFCLFDWDCSGRPSVTTTITTTTTTCQIIIRLIEWREVGEVELFKHSSQLNKSSEGYCRVLNCDANVCFSKYAELTETHSYYSLWGSHVSRHQRIVKFSSTFFFFPQTKKKKVVDFCLLNNLLRLIFIKGGGVQYCKTWDWPNTKHTQGQYCPYRYNTDIFQYKLKLTFCDFKFLWFFWEHFGNFSLTGDSPPPHHSMRFSPWSRSCHKELVVYPLS